MNKIILIGYAATGKTTVGRLLADRLKCKFFDTDRDIERRADMTVSDIFARFGEEYFRRLENEILVELTPQTDCVVACGGGSVCSPRFETFTHGGVTVWLKATAQTVASRLDGSRPLSDGKTVEEIAEHIAGREMLYVKFARLILVTDDCTPQQVAEEILRRLD